jgi:hypothetical protein
MILGGLCAVSASPFTSSYVPDVPPERGITYLLSEEVLEELTFPFHPVEFLQES